MARIDRVVWDTGVIIGLLERKPERYPLIAPFVEDAEAGQLEIVIANTSVVELQSLKGLRDSGKTPERTREIIQDFLSLPYVIRRPLHHALADYAGELAYLHSLKRAADAVALALAAWEGIPRLHTFDGSGSKRGLISLNGKVGNPPVTVEVPNHGGETLFGATDAN